MINQNESLWSSLNSIGKWTMLTDDQEDKNLSILNNQDASNIILQPKSPKINQIINKSRKQVQRKYADSIQNIRQLTRNINQIQIPQTLSQIQQQKVYPLYEQSLKLTNNLQQNETLGFRQSLSKQSQQILGSKFSLHSQKTSQSNDFNLKVKQISIDRPQITRGDPNICFMRDISSSNRQKIINFQQSQLTITQRLQKTTQLLNKPEINLQQTQYLDQTNQQNQSKYAKVKHRYFEEDQSKRSTNLIKDTNESNCYLGEIYSTPFLSNPDLSRKRQIRNSLVKQECKSFSPINFGHKGGQNIIQCLRNEQGMHDIIQRNLTKMLTTLNLNKELKKSRLDKIKLIPQVSQYRQFTLKDLTRIKSQEENTISRQSNSLQVKSVRVKKT